MERLTVERIKETGSYVGAPVDKEIEWVSRDGKKHSALITVKLSSYETSLQEFTLRNEGEDVLVSRVISSVIDEKGLPVFTREDIVGDKETGKDKMCASLFMALVIAVNEANGFDGGEEVKN